MRPFLPYLIVLALTASAFAQDRTNARSMVVSPYGIVATSQVQASQAGAEILARGGSAVDAAIAANATLGVIEPKMNGIGGDLFAIYWDAKTGKLYGLNASGWAPKGLTIAHLKAQGRHRNARQRASTPSPSPARSKAGTSCTNASATFRGKIFSRPQSSTPKTDSPYLK